MILPVRRLPWRTIQISINVVTIVLGFMTFLPLSYIKYYFKDQCMLYAQPMFLPHEEPSQWDVLLDLRRSAWGATSTCNFVTFFSVIVCIHSFIWCWFLLLMNMQLKVEQREYTILFPCFLLHALICVTVFVTSSIIQAGFDSWCFSLTKELFKTYGQKYTCAETQDLRWDVMDKKHNIYSFFTIANISSWLMTLSLLAQTVVSGYKIYAWILKTEQPHTNSIQRRSLKKTYETASGCDVTNDERTMASEVEWDYDESICEASKSSSIYV